MGNRHEVVGRMVADAEEFGNPPVGCRFRIATDDYDVSKKARVTEYHDVKAFGNQARVVKDYAGKGKLVRAAGVVRTEKYTPSRGPHAGHETQSRVIYINNASDFELLGGNPQSSSSESSTDDGSSW